MSREEPDVASGSRGLVGDNAQERPSITGGSDGGATVNQPVYRGRRDPTAPVGEECTVTVDGEQCLDCRYDLLSASPSGPEWGYGGSGPAQLAVALLADAFDDEFACDHYQRFNREVVSELPEEGWTLTKQGLNTWRRGLISE
jgi:hypothetical protein